MLFNKMIKIIIWSTPVLRLGESERRKANKQKKN